MKYCNECNEEISISLSEFQSIQFCPFCGAEQEEQQDFGGLVDEDEI